MAIAILNTDFAAADEMLAKSNIGYLRDQIALAIAAERKRCADIAMALDSKRGNESLIAASILSVPLADLGDSRRAKHSPQATVTPQED